MSVQISEKSAFAPIRYQATRLWWKTLGSFAAKGANYPFERRVNFLRDELQPYAHTNITKGTGIDHPQVIQNELSLLQVIGSFIYGGRTIYEFSETLTDSLAVTEFEDTTIGDVIGGQNNVYLHFGPHPFINVGGIQYEGFWVSFLEEDKSFSFQACRYQSFRKKPIHFSKNDVVDSYSLFFISTEQTIGSAIDSSIEKLESQRIDQLKQLDQIAAQYRAQGIRIETKAALEAIGGEIKSDDIKRISNLCFSALCYLRARPEDTEYGWPKDAPLNMVEHATHTHDSGKKASAENALENDGYLKIGYVGAKFEDNNQPRIFTKGLSDSEIKRIMSTHPRRGFFRKQPFGPGRQDRKIVYIAPTIVNPGVKMGLGKILSVDKKNDA